MESGMKAALKNPTNEIDIEQALTKADPDLGRLINAVVPKLGLLRITPSKVSSFEALTRAVIYQQMSNASAAAIYKRLKSTIGSNFTSKKLTSMTPDELRVTGISSQKAKYIHHLAEWFTANASIVKNLPVMSNDEIIKALTAISGIGVWTANVFLIFNLARLDVVPASDLGIQRGVQLIYGLEGLPSPELVHQKARLWAPYQSIASMYIWQAVKLKISAADLH
jgi:DNA-3-methyladenine glycosylase II